MPDSDAKELQAFVFKNRGALLAIPAVVLALFGKPSALSVTLGLPVAIAGELIRCWAVGYSGVTTRGNAVEAPKLVTAGPYAYVRHPGYLAGILIMVASGPALGSWLAAALLVISSLPFLIHRAITEDRVLCAELRGYRDYANRVRWRLLPGIW